MSTQRKIGKPPENYGDGVLFNSDCPLLWLDLQDPL